MEPECRIRLEVFEGPLDLLLHLITRNRLSITDISISLVTNQYLDYLEILQALDVEVAAEYLVMAATLMQIKSRMLLPAAAPPDQEDEPVMDIVGSLEELKRVKIMADLLEKRPILERDVFPPGPGDISDFHNQQTEAPEAGFDVTILDLVEAFKKVLGTKAVPRTIEILRARVDMEGRIEEIELELQKKGKMAFQELFHRDSTRHVIIVSFLAILELAKRGIIRLIQDVETKTIVLLLREET